jgi:phytol kinase
MSFSFLVFQAVKFVMLFAIIIVTGIIARKKLLKVNYTRKINHFAICFLPDLLYRFIDYELSNLTVVVGSLITIGYFALLVKPVRSRVKIFNTAFAAIDRPEDRPHTLVWFVTQFVAGTIVTIPVYLYFSHFYDLTLTYIPLLINGLGDGFAEPVGVRFGRHTYRVKPIFGKNMYVRTLEGSACVFVSAIAVLIYFRHLFTADQFVVALILLPLAATLTEAFSPHTWDAPFIIGACSLVLMLVKIM